MIQIRVLIKYSKNLTFNLLILSFLFLIFNSTNTIADIQTGLVAHWKFDEGSGTTASDSVGANMGTLVNGPIWIGGKIGNALSFDGIDDYVDLANPTSLQITGALTISAWAYRVGDGSIDIILARDGGSSDRGYRLTFETDNTAQFHVAWTSNSSTKTKSTVQPSNQWIHVVGVYNPSVGAYVYINGVLSGFLTNVPSSIRLSTSGPDIGRLGNNVSLFSGLIDDVRLYNRALTASDVRELYNEAIVSDITPPTRSNGLPSGTLSAGTTQTTISLTTDESAACKYSPTAGTSYASMTNIFSTTGASSHSTTVTGLSNGNSYNYYVRCQDTSGNANPDDFLISFSVASLVPLALPSVTIIASDAIASEPGTDTGQFTISRTGSIASSLAVSYTISGTAGNSADYTSISTSLTIPTGASSATITVTPIDDTLNEGSETVILTISSSGSYTIGAANTATVAINDNDISSVDPRTLGYIVVTDYVGVDSTGVGDSTAGIQQAIIDGHTNNKAIFFPQGTYSISDTLRGYEWQNWNTATNATENPDGRNYVLVGSTAGPSRPVIKLNTGSLPLFDDTTKPRPMIAFRNFVAQNLNAVPNALPPDPLGAPANFEGLSGNVFAISMQGIDFDTSAHAGAIGVTHHGAQGTALFDIKVIATGSIAGFYAIPGANGVTANVEVVGGKYGIINGPSLYPGLSLNGPIGPVMVGVKLINQTVAALNIKSESPNTVVGFYIIKNTAGPAILTPGSISLIDGQIEMQGAAAGTLAIDNTNGYNFYLRNVYVSGTSQLVKGGSVTTTGSGSWTLLKEYSYNDQYNKDGNTNPAVYPTYIQDDKNFESRSLINGVLSGAAIPTVLVINNAASPPTDLLSRHLWTKLPSFEDGPFVNIVNYGATPYYMATPSRNADTEDGNTGPDDTAAIQAAIDAASVAGHGRVVIPQGVFHISNTLTLHSNTKLFGTGVRSSSIAFHNNWQPTAEVPMIRTDDNPEATTFLGFLTLQSRSSPLANDYMGFLHWRAGRNSMSIVSTISQWVPINDPSNPKKFVKFTDNGGGRHYVPHVGISEGGRQPDSNKDVRDIHISGTTQPLSFYGANAEITKGGTCAASNYEIVNAANIRIYGMKREGCSPSVIINNSSNVALFSSSNSRSSVFAGSGGFMQILGSSNNVLMTNVNSRSLEGTPNGEATLREALTGLTAVSVPFPNMVSLYKRGEIDDAAMVISPIILAFDFSLSNSGAVSVTQGLSATNTITASLISSIIQPISYTVSDLPAGATSSFSPTSCNPTCSTTLTITTSSTTPAGNYIITVTGTGGSITRTTSFTLTVATTLPQPTLTLTASPSSITQGESSTLTWTSTNANSCSASGGWTGAKTLSGTEIAAPLANTTYTLSCTNNAGTATTSTTITVIKPEGDINGDKIVDIQDVLIVVKDFMKTSGYDTKVDLNNDGVINLFDIMAVVKHWGKMY